jgi:hypothetical protein
MNSANISEPGAVVNPCTLVADKLYPEGESIDVVYTWVDEANPKFKEQLRTYWHNSLSVPPESISSQRFRNNDELKYSLRSLEPFASWVGNIYIVTNGDIPTWLDTSHYRISIITHDKIFLDKSYLPTFNSNAIELQLHRIPNLSRQFLYFNDDVFLGRAVFRDDFITESGGQYIYFQKNLLRNKTDRGPVHDRAYAYTQKIINMLWSKKHSRLLPAHVPQLYDREILAYLEKLIPDEFQKTSSHRFRSADDLVLRVLYFFFLIESYKWDKRHEAVTLHWGSSNYSFVTFRNDLWGMWKAFLHIMLSKPKFFCINDDLEDSDSCHLILTSLRLFLSLYFPHPSSFEKEYETFRK